ncbi:protein NEOXANTHIN-DEFICIENT 1-like isoform X3 [Durio zibethinus]|uniref:Protein NEOXANTHIN-DEFICIENT 1-like isoform X3 n=1 Tax=Durio zibethinus TaxID=66656 RepID=A0A6P5YCN8_DURZI|nr:protein NEOXANTHIN-DEFICIENT 1-like isoform X3 [Durio zibethinus]
MPFWHLLAVQEISFFKANMKFMGYGETKSSTGYGRPPWIFKGSALYQLHLVKAETARAFIPREFRLVEAFGYTLGGFFLANYDDSPAGVFDELVVIAGIVWNPPSSCAWAARVLVNSEEACHHGRKRITPVPRQTKGKFGGFLNRIGVGTTNRLSKDCMDVQVTEVVGTASSDICNIKLITDVPKPKFNKWMGPLITMSLPSFSGQTEYNPNLLKYSCRIACRVRAVRPAKVSGPSPSKDRNSDFKTTDFTAEELVDKGRNLSISIMLSKPILALEFNCLEMQVEDPTILPNNSTCSLRPA